MALEKALITNTGTQQAVEVQFNPEEYTLNRGNSYSPIAVPGRDAPLLQFSHGEMKTLQMELFFDTHENHRKGSSGSPPAAAEDDVRTETRKLTSLMDIDPETHAPPVLLFSWGELAFLCVLATANQRFIMFRPDGVPVRARVQVTFNEYRNPDFEARQIKRRTADYTKSHVVRDGDSLPGIAFRHYGDAALWRPIAIRNRIEDPRRLPAGTELRVPRLPFRDPVTGTLYEATGEPGSGSNRGAP